MRLSRALTLLLAVAFSMAFLGTQLIVAANARYALQSQLDGLAADTATALAVSLGTLPAALDPVAAQTRIAPLFDRGQFLEIRFLDAAGREVAARREGAQPAAVPRWFRDALPFDVPTGQALVSSGWSQLGHVVVVVDPASAYGQLWRSLVQMLLLFAVLFGVLLTAVLGLVRWLLRPLADIEAMARAISERRFPRVDATGSPLDLRWVAEAMNLLSDSVRGMLEEAERQAGRLRAERLRDSLTGLLNAEGFALQAQVIVDDPEVSTGTLALVAVPSLDAANRRGGMRAGDAALAEFAAGLAAGLAAYGGLVGRRHGAVLSVLLPNIVVEAALALLRSVSRTGESPAIGAVGYAVERPRIDVLVEQAARALARALSADIPGALREAIYAPVRGDDRAVRVAAALDAGALELYAQAALEHGSSRPFVIELLARVRLEDGEIVAAADFIAAPDHALRLPSIDRYALRSAAQRLRARPEDRIAVNVSSYSAAADSYLAELGALLAERDIAARLTLEASTYAIARAPEAMQALAASTRAAGAGFAIDQFDPSSTALVAVHRLRPAYVKLAAHVSRTALLDRDVRFLVESMLAVLLPLGVRPIALGAESEAERDALHAMGFTVQQGFAVERPFRLD